MSKRIISLIAAMCLLLSSFALMNEAHAFQTVVSIGNPGRVNQGSNVTITFTVSETSGKFVTYDGAVSLSGATTLSRLLFLTYHPSVVLHHAAIFHVQHKTKYQIA